jgi:apolipoprotein N-acyltransferase
MGFTILLALGLAVVWAWGARRLQSEPSGEVARIALLQGNYDHIYKWSGKSLDDILRTYSRLSARAGEEKPDLAIWPETAVPVAVMDVPAALATVESSVRASGAYSLVGALKTPAEPGLEGHQNTAFLFDPSGRKLPEEYHKRHLVPFGEYVPLKKLLFFVDIVSAGASIFVPGDQATVFSVPLGRRGTLDFGVLICYESAFPQMAREYVQTGANLLVVITNDAWYGRTAMPHQHGGLAALRAVENGVPMVRAANTGLTCWSDARGRIGGILRDEQGESLFAEGLLIAEPRLERLDTFYSRWGDVFGVGCLVLTLAAGSFSAATGRRKPGRD